MVALPAFPLLVFQPPFERRRRHRQTSHHSVDLFDFDIVTQTRWRKHTNTHEKIAHSQTLTHELTVSFAFARCRVWHPPSTTSVAHTWLSFCITHTHRTAATCIVALTLTGPKASEQTARQHRCSCRASLTLQACARNTQVDGSSCAFTRSLYVSLGVMLFEVKVCELTFYSSTTKIPNRCGSSTGC